MSKEVRKRRTIVAGELLFCREIKLTYIFQIIVIHIKVGKLRESEGRKAMGLRPEEAMIARLRF